MRSETNTREIALADMAESARNPRKIFRGLEALAVSLRENGQLQAILVRPSPVLNGAAAYEIVVGARRFRAAAIAGRPTLRAEIRNLTDREALECSLVENDQRESVHPLEEAEGYRRLQEDYGATVEQIAAKVGHSVQHVYQRLRLVHLCEPGRKLFFNGRILIAGAFMIARLPVLELQVQLCEEIGRVCGEDDGSEGEAPQPVDSWRIRKMISDRYLTDLGAAPWPKKSPMLDTKGEEVAPSCSSCPKRTGNQGQLFEEAPRDLCTDALCYALKKRTHLELVQVRLKDEGRPVFDAKTSRAYFLGGSATISTSAPFLDLDAPFALDGKGRTLRALLGKKIPAEQIVGAIDGAGGVHELLPKEAVADALAAAGHEQTAEASRKLLASGDKVKSFANEEDAKAAVQRLVVASSLEAMVKVAERRAPALDFWTVILTALVGMVGGKAMRLVCERRGVEIRKPVDLPGVLGGMVLSGNEQHARALVFELALAHGVTKGTPQAFEDACTAFGVDDAKERAKARKALKLAPLGGRPTKPKKARLEDLADDDDEEPAAPCCEVVRVFREGQGAKSGSSLTGCMACEALGEQIEEVIAEQYVAVPKRTLLIDHVTEGGEGVVGEHHEPRVLAVLAELERRGRVWEDPKGNLHTQRRALRKRYVTHGAVSRRVG